MVSLAVPRSGVSVAERQVDDELFQLLRAGIDFLNAQAKRLQQRAILPALLKPVALWADDCGLVAGDTDHELVAVLETLFELRQQLAAQTMQTCDLVADLSTSSPEPAELHRTAVLAYKRLAVKQPSQLASNARRLHFRANKVCTDIFLRLGHSADDWDKTQSSNADMVDVASGSTDDVTKKVTSGQEGMHKLTLSKEQQLVVSCAQSIFIQGRSGTGKTLALVRRMHRARLECASCAQLFVTKSSLLRDEVEAHLKAAGRSVRDFMLLKTSEEPLKEFGVEMQDVIVLTWTQLVQLVLGPDCLHANKIVHYTLFESVYWPRLRKSVSAAKKLPPQLVWAEINTRLRSFQQSNHLSQREYLKDNVAAIGLPLDEGDQRLIHAIFMEYKKMLKEDGKIDEADVASLVGAKIDADQTTVGRVYVDEAQDFSPSELMLFIRLCNDPCGLTVAGDTCQTINPGSAFSFSDIAKAFRSHWIQKTKDKELRKHAYACQILTLSVNYRCAPRITALAESVTDVLFARFPTCADRIEEEAVDAKLAADDDTLPVFVDHCRDTCLHDELTGFDSTSTVILVRDDAARTRLRSKVCGTILTIPEAKGLEYDMVVIYRFFSDSPGAWALEAACEADPDTEPSNSTCPPDLKVVARQMSMAIPELKQLYVAITRARVGCGFLEPSSAKCPWAPLLKRWERGGLIDCTSSLVREGKVKDNFLNWLYAELEARQGHKERQARQFLTTERDRIWRGGRVDPAFRSSFESQYGPCQHIPVDGTDDAASQERFQEWLSREIRARTNESDAAARKRLTQERARLRKGRFDADFRARFELEFGDSKSVAPENDDNIIAIMNTRFQVATRDLDEVTHTLRQRGVSLLRHALDNPSERWHVFAEARDLLQQALKAECLAVKSKLLSDDVALDDEFGVSTDTWRPALFAVIREGLRQTTWRGRSSLSLLARRPHLWVNIFSFLVNDRPDIHNVAVLFAECLRDSVALHQELVYVAVFSHAWYKRCDTNGNEAFELDFMRQRLLKRYVTGQQRHIASKAESGRAFLAIQKPRLAAETFSDAATVAARTASAIDCMRQATHSFKPGEMGITCDVNGFVQKVNSDGPAHTKGIKEGDHIVKVGIAPYSKDGLSRAEKSGIAYNVMVNPACDIDSVAILSAERRARNAACVLATHAANAWLLSGVKEAPCASLEIAASEFSRAGRWCEAATCAANLGQFRVALSYLAGGKGVERRRLVFMCAYMISQGIDGASFVASNTK